MMERTFIQHSDVALNFSNFGDARGVWWPRELKDVCSHLVFEAVCLQLGIDLELFDVLYGHLSQSGVDFRARLNLLWPVLPSQPAIPSACA